MVFQAGLHGINLNKEITRGSSKTESKEAAPLFKSQEEYAHLSEDEKRELTKKMLNEHKFKFG